MNARLRYRIDEGQLLLGYALDRPDEVARSAFLDVRTAIGDATGYDVLAGRTAG